jgi:MFS transporter, MHS family, proline/betaine transporter
MIEVGHKVARDLAMSVTEATERTVIAEADIDPVGRRAIVAACIGTAIEYYDLFVYLYFATTIAKLFFPAGNEFVSLLTAFGAFGLTFIAKPVGALVFSNYADRISRKSALTATLTLMAIGIGMITFVPTYATIGIAAPFIVILARLIQAFSTGGEYAASTAFLVERSPARLRGYYSSFNIAALGLTSVIGGAVGLTLNNVLTPAQIAGWGWRVPFAVGLSVIPISLYLRRTIPDIEESKRPRSRMPLREVTADHKLLLLLCIGGFMLVTISNYALAFFLPTYAVKNLGLTPTVAFTATTAFGLMQCVFSPVFGLASDRHGRKKVMVAAAIGLLFLTLPCFFLLVSLPSIYTLIASELILGVLATAYQAPMPAFLCDLLPANVRTTGVAIVHDFTATVVGGVTPFFITLMIGLSGSNMVPGLYMMAAAAVSMSCLLAIKNVLPNFQTHPGVPFTATPKESVAR